jgi:hypothetical protein
VLEKVNKQLVNSLYPRAQRQAFAKRCRTNWSAHLNAARPMEDSQVELYLKPAALLRQ